MLKFPTKVKKIQRKCLSTLKKWRGQATRATQARGSDAVSVRVAGSVNRGVVVAAHDLILQPGAIGSSVIGVGLAVLIFVFAVSFNGLRIATAPASFTQGDDLHLDLVILPFESANGSTSGECSQIGRGLSDQIAQMTADQLHKLDLKDTQSIRVWAPGQMDSFKVEAGESLAQAVERFANERQVSIVLYGSLTCDAATLTVDSYFYLRAADDKDAVNLLGSYTFDPFVINRTEKRGSTATNVIDTWVSERANALLLLSQALGYYDHHTRDMYLQAARLLEQAHFSNSDDGMQAITQVFIANAYMRAVVNDCNQDFNQDYLGQAMAHYKQALQSDDQSARAYLGLGNVMNTFALALFGSDVDQAQQYLDQAEQYFKQALNSGGQPLNNAMKWQIQIARAQSRLVQHDAVLDSNPDLADRLLNEAHTLVTQLINAYEGAGVTIRSQQTVAAYAYFIAGRIHESNGDVTRAWALYQRAQALAPASDARLQAELALRMAQVETLLGNVCAATKQYRLASQYNICPQSRQDITNAIQDFQSACSNATRQP